MEGVMRRPDGKSADEVAEQEKWLDIQASFPVESSLPRLEVP